MIIECFTDKQFVKWFENNKTFKNFVLNFSTRYSRVHEIYI